MRFLIVRAEDNALIGSVGGAPPFDIVWTKQSASVDREYIERLFKEPVSTLKGGATEDGRFYTTREEVAPESDNFLLALLKRFFISPYALVEEQDGE